jgi:hypothetical protein
LHLSIILVSSACQPVVEGLYLSNFTLSSYSPKVYFGVNLWSLLFLILFLNNPSQQQRTTMNSAEDNVIPRKGKRQKCSDDYDKDDSVNTIKTKLSELRMSVAHAWNSSIATTLDLLGVNPSRKTRQMLFSHEQVMNLLLSSTVEDPESREMFLAKEASLRVSPGGPYRKRAQFVPHPQQIAVDPKHEHTVQDANDMLGVCCTPL